MFISNPPEMAEKEGKFFFKRKKGNNRKNECNRQRTVTNMVDNTSTVTLY